MPYFSKQRCEEIIKKACAMNAWTSNRHKNYPTTDIPVHKISQPGHGKGDQRHIRRLHAQVWPRRARKGVRPVRSQIRGGRTGPVGTAQRRVRAVIRRAAIRPKGFEGGGTYYETTDQTMKCNQGDVVFHCGR